MGGRVLVVGGGIGGLTAAVALRRAGVPVRVLERAPALREVGAGLTLWANATRVLARLGLADAVAAAGAVLDHSEMRRWDGKLLAALAVGKLSAAAGAATVGVHRADLQRVLAAAVGDDLTLGAAAVGFHEEPAGVCVRLSDGREERGVGLVGADGLRSPVRAQLLGPARPRLAGQVAWRGVASEPVPGADDGVTVLAVGRGSQVGFVPVGGGRTYWFATANLPAGWHDPPGGAKPQLLHRFGGWHPPIPQLIAATPDAAIRRDDVTDRPPAAVWGRGRVTLLGDAAHPTTPNLGQGACQAIEDAACLADELADTLDVAAAFRAYEAKRMGPTAAVTRKAWWLGQALALESGPLCWARDTLFRAFPARAERDLAKLLGGRPG